MSTLCKYARWLIRPALGAALACLPGALSLTAQAPPVTQSEWNARLEQLRRQTPTIVPGEYRIGAEDLLEISVFEAAELNRAVRVAANGEIALPLVGPVRAAGLTPRELESVLEELLRRSYVKDPHVSVYVREMQSHAVSVVGAVKKPGLYQIRGRKTLVEVLAMAEGLSEDAGDTILVLRGPGAATNSPLEEMIATPEAPRQKETVNVDLKRLLESGDDSLNVAVEPGDVVKVSRAGIVYVIGDVRKPGGFLLKTNERITALQALALAEGLNRTAARGRARIIRTDEPAGGRREIALDLGKMLAGKSADVPLEPRDILFVPGSGAKVALYRGAEAALSIVTGVVIWRR